MRLFSFEHDRVITPLSVKPTSSAMAAARPSSRAGAAPVSSYFAFSASPKLGGISRIAPLHGLRPAAAAAAPLRGLGSAAVYVVSPVMQPRRLRISHSNAAALDLRLPSCLTDFFSFGPPSSTSLESENRQNQFMLFQMSRKRVGPRLLDSTQVEPEIDSSRKQDVLVALSMECFHIAANEEIDSNSRATLRITFSKHKGFADKRHVRLSWALVAGLNLYDDTTGERTESKNLKADFHEAMGNRPIEIPGGLANLKIEVVKHKEPGWWQKAFKFLRSDSGKGLTSVLGFPAITDQAINMLDEMLSRLQASEAKTLFQSDPVVVALSKQARDSYLVGDENCTLGCLNHGRWIFARARDFETITSSNAIYHAGFGKLVPKGVADPQIVTGNYDDPFRNITYAALKVKMRETKLDPTLGLGS